MSALADLRLSLRGARRAPGFAAAVVGTLALGIGLAAAMGAIARAIAFDALPVRDQARVVVLWGEQPRRSFAHLPLALADAQEFARASRTMTDVAGVDYNGAWEWTFRSEGVPARYRGSLVGGAWFRMLGVVPLVGRTLRPEDDVEGAPRVMVIGEGLWRRDFGGDPGVVGRTLVSHTFGTPYTIVGVVPSGLDVPRGAEFWTPVAATTMQGGRSWSAVDVYGRLRPGATAEQARAEYTAFRRARARSATDVAATADLVGTVRTLGTHVVGDVRPALAAVAAAALLVLAIACVNVAGLLLLRTARRHQELAVRAAIGAGAPRLVRQLLVEHGALAVLGGALGAGVAALAVRAFVALAPAELPRLGEVRVDGALLALATLATGAVVLLVGLVPALGAGRVPVADALRRQGRGVFGGRGAGRARRALVAVQVALALVVLAGAGLVTRSLARLQRVELGFAGGESVAVLPLARAAAADEARGGARYVRDRTERLLARVRATPGVVDAATVTNLPFSGTGGWDGLMEAEGRAAADSASMPWLNMESTGASYLRTMGVALLRGRFLADADREGAAPVVVLSASAARRIWPGQDAIGRRLRFAGGDTLWRTVVGVVADTRYRDLVDPRPSIYFPYRQFPQPPEVLAVRTVGDAARLVPALRAAVAEAAPDVLLGGGGTMTSLLGRPLARPRLTAALLSTFAAIALVLTAVGLFGVVAASVAQRDREFGVRSALGARPRELARLALGEGLALAAVGAGVGLAATLGATRLLASSLYEITPTDPPTLAATAALLLAVCAAACLVPARRAARVDPATVLRGE